MGWVVCFLGNNNQNLFPKNVSVASFKKRAIQSADIVVERYWSRSRGGIIKSSFDTVQSPSCLGTVRSERSPLRATFPEVSCFTKVGPAGP